MIFTFLTNLTLAVPLLISSAGAEGLVQDLSGLKVPAGFKISPYVTGIQGARSMALSPSGTLYVGSRDAGRVYAVQVAADGKVMPTQIIAELDTPNGVAYRDGALYVAQRERLVRFDDIDAKIKTKEKLVPIVLRSDLPKEEHHGWRYMRISDDGWIYVDVGAPCNVCERDPNTYGTILRYSLDGKKREVVARGVRDSVGFDFHPFTHELWFTDNGRDMLGDDKPDDELNHLSKMGEHFGFPYCHQGNILDPEFGKGKKCSDYTAPVQLLGPHVAALGMRFYIGEMFPAKYHNQIFIAEHGSWNRTVAIGYRVMVVKLDGNKAVGYEPFVTGFLKNEGKKDAQPIGRPVDVLVKADGSLLISDDFAGMIYRVTYQPPN